KHAAPATRLMHRFGRGSKIYFSTEKLEYRMRNFCRLTAIAAAALFSFPSFAQLTTDQKIAEFLYVADSYNNQYGPYEWKQKVEGFDLLDLRPWVERIRRTGNDIEYAETLVDYVASLNDAHDDVSFPLNFRGNLGF